MLWRVGRGRSCLQSSPGELLSSWLVYKGSPREVMGPEQKTWMTLGAKWEPRVLWPP